VYGGCLCFILILVLNLVFSHYLSCSYSSLSLFLHNKLLFTPKKKKVLRGVGIEAINARKGLECKGERWMVAFAWVNESSGDSLFIFFDGNMNL
jgi:hypothetical protein